MRASAQIFVTAKFATPYRVGVHIQDYEMHRCHQLPPILISLEQVTGCTLAMRSASYRTWLSPRKTFIAFG